MKVGIITYHKAYNYGSALQAYALNTYLNNLGIDTYTIDYQTDHQAELYKLFEKPRDFYGLARDIHSILLYSKLKKHINNFDLFIKDRIKLTNAVYRDKEGLETLNEQFDYFICGSDQIWNPHTIDFDDAYLLSFVKDKGKCIAYAPSIGTDSLEDKYKKSFRNALIDYKALSCREEKGTTIISEITEREVSTVLDPVFLLNMDKWMEILPHTRKRKYIFGYFIGDVPGMRNFAYKLSKIIDVPVLVTYKNLRDLMKPHINAYEAGPLEFLSLLVNSEYIVTNSFHAVAFSLIFKKQFWVFKNDSPNMPNSRIEDLLSKVGLQERILTNGSVKEDINKPVIYTNTISNRISTLIDTSVDYLNKALFE